MNMKRLFSNYYLTWDDYKKLVYTMEFLNELNKAMATSEIKRLGGEVDGV